MFQLTNLLKNPIGWLTKGELWEYVISSRIRLARNLDLVKFPHVATNRELKLISQKVWEAARHIKDFGSTAYVKLTDIGPVDQQFLLERHLISADLIKNPQERAVIIGEQEFLSVMINEEDHLRIQVILPGLELEVALNEALRVDAMLAKQLPYAYSKDFGFLTSCPTNIGTGLRASCLIHLPALSMAQEMPAILQDLARVGLTARGFYGEGSKVYGDLFQISNATSIGKNEKEFVSTIGGVIQNILEHEAKTRERLFRKDAKTKALDRFWRAYAALAHARLLSFEETMQSLSLVRLGISLGIKFNHLSIDKINQLTILTQPAHIQMQAGKELGAQQRDELRAQLIRKTLGTK